LTLGANAKKKVEIIDNTVDSYTRIFYTQATEARDGSYQDSSSGDASETEEDTAYE